MPLAARLRSMLDGFADRVLAVAGAVLFSQAPEFFQQYLQRLGGHLDEARRILAQFEQAAGQAGLTLADYIRRTAANTDTAVARLADTMAAAAERVQSLQAAHDALRDASAWTRPFVFLRHLDWDIARGTLSVFKPAVPVTLEGGLYALAGMLLFVGLYHLLFHRFIARANTVPSPSGAKPV
jgi:hypothetical protein